MTVGQPFFCASAFGVVTVKLEVGSKSKGHLGNGTIYLFQGCSPVSSKSNSSLGAARCAYLSTDVRYRLIDVRVSDRVSMRAKQF